jgi:hypothetical protein
VIDRRLCAAAVAALGLMPIIPAVAASPGPSALPSALADPVESGFMEVDQGTSNTLEGYFDASAYARSLAADGTTQQQIVDYLNQYGFVTGYGRDWYLPRRSDWLDEIVMVFNDRSGAAGVASSSKINYARGQYFGSFIDVSRIPNAYGLTETINGFHWTIVTFTKGNDLFSIARGSDSDFMTDQAVTQADKAYAVAPNGTALAGQVVPTSGFSQYVRPLEVVAFVGALVSSVVLAVMVIVIFGPRGRQTPTVGEAPKP